MGDVGIVGGVSGVGDQELSVLIHHFMVTLLRLIGITLLIWLISITGTKLFKMAQIRGVMMGSAPVVKTITGKSVSTGHPRNSYLVAWDGADPAVSGPDRINLPQELWDSFQPGDPIEVLYFPGDARPYHRMGLYANNGNIGFDVILLCVWFTGLISSSSPMIRHVLRRSR